MPKRYARRISARACRISFCGGTTFSPAYSTASTPFPMTPRRTGRSCATTPTRTARRKTKRRCRRSSVSRSIRRSRSACASAVSRSRRALIFSTPWRRKCSPARRSPCSARASARMRTITARSRPGIPAGSAPRSAFPSRFRAGCMPERTFSSCPRALSRAA